MAYTALLVEDEITQRMITSRMLDRKLGMKVKEASNGKEALYFIKHDEQNEIDLIILDLIMPEMDGFEAMQKILELRPNIPIIVATASEEVNDAVKAIKMGAVDFLTKPIEPERLHISVENALRINTLTAEVTKLRKQYSGTLNFSDIIGHDMGLAEIISRARKAAASDIPVLINGETGTGKELFARAIHGESKRFGAPFIAVNCAAIPQNLVESTLFGHEKGSFTGAIAKSIGKFREAEGGTLFLDEIGELPLEVQAKLLRVLQQKEIEPVGAGQNVKVNVRIISATNRVLAADVSAKKFREDLLFRLNVLPIELPPLRRRRRDIIPLAYHFLAKFSATEKKQLRKISAEAENLLIENEWNGNVRELENTIFRAVVMSDGNILESEDIKFSLTAPSSAAVSYKSDSAISLFSVEGKFKTLSQIEDEIIELAIRNFSGNIPQAAEALGVAKSTIYRKKH